MKKALLGCVALACLSGPAWADDITLTATVDGTLVDTIDSGGLPTLDISNVSFGNFNLNSLTLNSQAALAAGGILHTNTLDVDQTVTGNNTLVLHVVATGLTGPGALQDLVSSFSVTGLTAGWKVQESTSLNGSPLASTPVFTGNNATASTTTAALVTNPFSADVEYTVTSNGTGSFNGGVDVDAVLGAPGPAVASGLPGLAAMLLGGLLLWKRRRSPA